MRSWSNRIRPHWLAISCAALMVVVVIGGGLIFWRPSLTRSQQPVAEIPSPPALSAITEFPVPPHQQACMQSVTVTPDSGLAAFRLRPAKPSPGGGPPVELTLSAAGYRGSVGVPGGYPGGSVSLPIVPPPKRPVIATACFLNRGRAAVLLDGTTEPRTVSRSATAIAGRPVLGDIALSFYERRPQTVLEGLGEIFGHASNLTDGLLPVGAIWVFAVLAAFGVPIAIILAFYAALREDEASAAVTEATAPGGSRPRTARSG